jgi:uncharacterized protein involved in outer membrane biogenesis
LAIHRGLKWTIGLLAALVAALAALVGAVETGYFRDPLIRYVATRAGREFRVEGTLETHVFSCDPRLIAERVVIGNPPWMPAGLTAEIGKVTLVIEMPCFGHSFGIEKLEMEGATLHLARDSAGRANWQLTDPSKESDQSLPIIRSLSMPTARVELDDARRHLQFNGTVSAQDVNGPQATRPLRIEGTGQLNGRTASFQVDGDPLAAASHDAPYRFVFTERSSGSRLDGSGFLPRPFDFDVLDASFAATGADLKDLYFLTGVTLIHTGAYHASGKMTRRGTNTKFSELAATSGESDIRGAVSIETSSGRPKLVAELNSQFLRTEDLGARAAGRDSESAAGAPLLLSNAALDPSATRRGDALVNYHSRRLDIGRIPLQGVAATMAIDHGVLVVAPLLASVFEGKLTARVRLDASTDDPAAELDLKIADLQLGGYFRDAPQPPADGLLRARVIVKGRGRSVHQVAASSNGTVTAVLSHGTIRSSLAELTGIDLRGLGMLLGKSVQSTPIRCAIASFQAHDGTLAAQSLIVDTEPVLVTGEGVIHMDSESLDLTLRGHPKGLRLRLRSALLVRGTLLHPSVGIQAGSAVAQTAAAVALGVILSPLASVLVFVDPGLAKDADCAGLLAASKTL